MCQLWQDYKTHTRTYGTHMPYTFIYTGSAPLLVVLAAFAAPHILRAGNFSTHMPILLSSLVCATCRFFASKFGVPFLCHAYSRPYPCLFSCQSYEVVNRCICYEIPQGVNCKLIVAVGVLILNILELPRKIICAYNF